MSDRDRDVPNPIGERLKAAREAKGMSLDDVATTTRVPIRHLQHIESGDWDALPAPTYSVGFARAYANAIGLNGTEIGSELRDQLGNGPKRTSAAAFYEPADPARVPPKSLAIVAGIVALLLIVGYAVWRNGAVDDTAIDEAEIASVNAPLAEEPAPPLPGANQPLGGPSAAAGGGPVVITAVNDVWLRVYEAGGPRLFENTLKAGERYEVPSNAQKPLIITGRPDALRVSVGATQIPQLGPAQRTIADVSLAPADLLARVQGAAPAGQAPVAAPAPAG